VEDRGLDHLCHIGGVKRGAGFRWEGGEADLVIDDDVDGTAGVVTGKLRHIEDLRYDALAGERGVAMEEEREDLVAVVAVIEDALACAGHALDDGVDGLEVAGIRGETDADLRAGRGGAGGGVAKVIFYIAIAANEVRDVVFRELGEEGGEGFCEEIGEDIEASAMGHAHDDLHDAAARAVLEDGVESGHEGLGALEGKAFLANVLGVEEVLEVFGLEEFAQESDLEVAAGGRVVGAGFDALAQPVPDTDILDVHELETDGAGIDEAENVDHLAQHHHASAEQEAGGDGEIEVLFLEAEFAKAEKGLVGALADEGIELGDSVADGAIGVDEALDACLEGEIGEIGSGRGSGAIEGRGGAGGAVGFAGDAEFEAFEESGPGGGDVVGVMLPARVLIFQEFNVDPGGDSGSHFVVKRLGTVDCGHERPKEKFRRRDARFCVGKGRVRIRYET